MIQNYILFYRFHSHNICVTVKMKMPLLVIYISETLSGIKLIPIVVTFIGASRCVMLWCDLDLTVNLCYSHPNFSNLAKISETVKF